MIKTQFITLLLQRVPYTLRSLQWHVHDLDNYLQIPFHST